MEANLRKQIDCFPTRFFTTLIAHNVDISPKLPYHLSKILTRKLNQRNNFLSNKNKSVQKTTKKIVTSLKEHKGSSNTISKLSRQNQYELMEENFRLSLINTMRQIKEKCCAIYLRDIGNQIGNQSLLNLQKLETRKSEYLRIMTDQIRTNQSISDIQWIPILKQYNLSEIWHILYGQFYNGNILTGDLTCIIRNSLQLVQKTINKNLPTSQAQLCKYLINRYAGKIKYKTYKPELYNQELIYALEYICYVAGRDSQYNFSNKSQIYDNNIESVNINYATTHKVRDHTIFDKILNKIQNGQIEEILEDYEVIPKESIQLVCIILRSVSFLEVLGASKLEQLRTLYIERSQQHLIKSANAIRNLLYLLGYYQIAMIGPNQLISETQYLFYLLIIVHTPSISSFFTLEQQRDISVRFSHQLKMCIADLLMTQNISSTTLTSLLVLYPKTDLIEQASEAIAASNSIKLVDWNLLQKYVGIQTYHELIYETYLKLIKYSDRPLDLICQYSDSYKKPADACELLISYLLWAKDTACFHQYCKKRQVNFIEKITGNNLNLAHQCLQIVTFIDEYKRLVFVVGQMNEHSMINFVNNAHYIWMISKAGYQMMHYLLSRNSLELYVYFIDKCLEILSQCNPQYNKKHMRSLYQNICLSFKIPQFSYLKGNEMWNKMLQKYEFLMQND